MVLPALNADYFTLTKFLKKFGFWGWMVIFHGGILTKVIVISGVNLLLLGQTSNNHFKKQPKSNYYEIE